jgi:hypothetical protein
LTGFFVGYGLIEGTEPGRGMSDGRSVFLKALICKIYNGRTKHGTLAPFIIIRYRYRYRYRLGKDKDF